MKAVAVAVVAVALLGAVAAFGAVLSPESKEVRAEGCVEPGIEVQCLIVKDIKSGTLYNLFVKEPRPSIGDGIEFTAVPFDGMTYCMQGTAVVVTHWARRHSLKCVQSGTPKK